MGKKKQKEIEAQEYKDQLRNLQIELVKLQHHLISKELKILILFEGRDAAGKDGVIKRIREHLSPRETRVVALGPPSDYDRRSWYFRRYAIHLPSTQEMVLMNRSWYNRAGVERVMGFCSDEEYRNFMESVQAFEKLLIQSGIQLLKYYLDISKDEQKKRLMERKTDPLTQWKTSPIDEVAHHHWSDYSAARNEMFARTHSELSPWYIVKADHKKSARLNLIRHLLSQVEWPGKASFLSPPDSDMVFSYAEYHVQSGAIAP